MKINFLSKKNSKLPYLLLSLVQVSRVLVNNLSYFYQIFLKKNSMIIHIYQFYNILSYEYSYQQHYIYTIKDEKLILFHFPDGNSETQLI